LSWIELQSKEALPEDVIKLALQVAPELGDSLFDETTELNRILAEIPDEKFDSITAEEK
jgi:hypothetical protein